MVERRENMGEFNPINSQEELDAIIKGRIERERKVTAEKYADYEELKNSSLAYETKIADLTKALDEANEKINNHNSIVESLNGKITEYETKATRVRLAREVGLDLELADRITGNDEAEMKADAESLAKLFKTSHAQPLAISEPIQTTTASKEDVALKEIVSGLFNN